MEAEQAKPYLVVPGSHLGDQKENRAGDGNSYEGAEATPHHQVSLSPFASPCFQICFSLLGVSSRKEQSIMGSLGGQGQSAT